jgi:hypothetical protein
MTAYAIGIEYEIETKNNKTTANYHGYTIDPPLENDSNTSINNNGKITMGKGDTSVISYTSVTAGWDATEVQLRDDGKTSWSPGQGENQLTADEATDYPGVDAHTGSKSKDATGKLSVTNNNSKASTVKYRVALSNGTSTVWSDPRIKDNGN